MSSDQNSADDEREENRGEKEKPNGYDDDMFAQVLIPVFIRKYKKSICFY